MAGMGLKMDYDGIDHLNQGIGSMFKALAMGPLMQQQAQQKAAALDATAYAHNMQGNEHGAKAASEQFTLGQRQGIDDLIAQNPQLAEYAKNMYRTFKMTGDTNAERVAKAGSEFQTQGIRDQAVANVGDLDKMNRLNTLAKPGDTYMPFDNIGNTGTVFSKATGEGKVASTTLDKIFGNESRAKIGKENAQAFQASAAGKDHLSHIPVNQAHATKLGQEITQGKRVLRETDAGLVSVSATNPNDVVPVTMNGQALGKPLKDIPQTVNTAIIHNTQGLNQIDRALALLNGEDVGGMKGDKNATGWKGHLPNGLLNRMDPDGVDARAEISDIGSLKIHDRSGAAVTISESPRLMPFVPLATDDAATVKKKLGRLKIELANESDALASTYSKEQGYKPNPVKPAAATKRDTTANPMNAGSKAIVRTGTLNGRKVVQYSDGSTGFAD